MDDQQSKEKNEEDLPEIKIEPEKMEHLEKGAQLKKEKDEK